MVWPFSSSKSSDDSTSTSTTPPPTGKEQKFLDELPPKFDESPAPGTTTPVDPSQPRPTNLQSAISTISADDFTKLHQIPCFRDAMLTGGAVGGAVLAVMITTRSAVPRAMNWAVGGFLVGAMVTWEQCRWKLRQEKKEQRMAREMYKQGSKHE